MTLITMPKDSGRCETKNKWQFHTNFPVENDDNMMLESSLPLIIIVLSIAEVTQLTAAICSLQRNSPKCTCMNE